MAGEPEAANQCANRGAGDDIRAQSDFIKALRDAYMRPFRARRRHPAQARSRAGGPRGILLVSGLRESTFSVMTSQEYPRIR